MGIWEKQVRLVGLSGCFQCLGQGFYLLWGSRQSFVGVLRDHTVTFVVGFVGLPQSD